MDFYNKYIKIKKFVLNKCFQYVIFMTICQVY